MLVPIEARPTLRLGVIAMPHSHILESHGLLQMTKRQLAAFLTDNVIPGNVGVASIYASAHGYGLMQ